MDKCACGYFDKIRAWRPESNELYREIKVDLEDYREQKGKMLDRYRPNDVSKPRTFEEVYLNPTLNVLALVGDLIQDDSLNSLTEDEGRDKLQKALRALPEKKKLKGGQKRISVTPVYPTCVPHALTGRSATGDTAMARTISLLMAQFPEDTDA